MIARLRGFQLIPDLCVLPVRCAILNRPADCLNERLVASAKGFNKSPMPSPKIRILVVESDVSVRKTVSWLLVKEGYEVSSANDGFDALLHLQKELPDLILS